MLGLKKGDIILTASLLFFAVASLVLVPIWLGNGDGTKDVVVTVDGSEVLRQALPQEGQTTQAFTFLVDEREYTGTLEFADGRVTLQRLDREIVPLSIHHDMGPISQTYQSIVALPVRLLVRLEATHEEELEFDVVAH